MIVHVNVGDDEIASGRRHSPYLCPVAIGTHRGLSLAGKRRWTCEVGALSTLLKSPSGCKAIRVEHPEPIRRRIMKYDYRNKIEPFAYDIELLDDRSLPYGYIKEESIR